MIFTILLIMQKNKTIRIPANIEADAFEIGFNVTIQPIRSKISKKEGSRNAEPKNKTFFDLALELLQDFKFGQSFKVTQNTAKQYRLYDLYRSDFSTIRILAFQNKDWSQAAFYLARLLTKLSDEVRWS